MKNREIESVDWQTFVPSSDYYIKGKKLNPVIIKQAHSHTNTLPHKHSFSLFHSYTTHY